MTSNILTAAITAAERLDYSGCAELLAGMSDEELRVARTTLIAVAAQINPIIWRPLPVPAGVDGFSIGSRGAL
jgi:hypothetical protein